MNPPLTDVEVRVLGALLEKARTTPDSYPLSLNALTNACNQASNREPVMALAETEVSAAVDALRRRSLVRAIVRSGAGVTKYQHLVDEALGLVNRQLAVLCVLMLRGPQTAGELRTRTQRLHDFDDVADVESALASLASREPEPLVVRLPRRPGQREERWAHTLAPLDERALAADAHADAASARGAPRAGGREVAADDERVRALESEVAQLRRELADLRAELASFRKQFE